jgi:hypothetical protein
MKKTAYYLITVLSLFTTCSLQADTIELADGTLLEGDFIGSSNGIIMFDTGTGIEAFPESKVVGIYFSSGVATREGIEKETANSITVPTGTRLVIRTIDTIDSSRHSVGHRFRGQLEGALVVGGVTVAPRGAYVHGRITQANQSSDLAGTFTDILIDDQLVPISTGDLGVQVANEGGRRAAGRTARAAAVGGLMGGNSGARRGARIGVGASIVASGSQSSINIPAGTIVEATLSVPLVVQQ